ncbi:DUF2778 domain-containing protein [Pseudodesulfovibrio portus]|uniref:YkuD domain-containing protein n=1 Tax=Pseudodesulfovibrio portus TaxID=231439 RepID=A0ABM8ASX8_9BACT|nr:DUF2778 domain-containing protein [Pseudodesulfovibrio portus]BDQ34565.1 hypothetical protein JCM14722_21070 [Pseudodesulfovibrio portus]
MAQNESKRTGEDQLVHGLPKHMSATATGENLDQYMAGQKAQGKVEGEFYWTAHPKPGACERCLDMAKETYPEEPKRPHPNCKCVYKKHDIKDPETDWMFDGTHLCIKGGPCFAAVSGGFGKGALPPGVYNIITNAITLENIQETQGYCDKHGNCWWVKIAPTFDANGRGGFGIHPDGNKSGTLGCIGLSARDTSEAKGHFKNVEGQKILVK